MPGTAPVALASTPSGGPEAGAIEWRAQEMLLLSQVMRSVGQSLAPEVALREMLHLMSELLGLNRGRIVLHDAFDDPPLAPARGATEPTRPPARIRHAYGLTREEVARGLYDHGEGVTGRVLATGQPAIVQDVDAEPAFLFRAVARERLPPETVAFIALPIEVERRTVGVLACHRIRSRHRQLSDDVALLRILATLAGQLLQLQRLVAATTRGLQARNEQLTRALESAAARYGIVGTSAPLLSALGELERVSSATASVLLLGESGTGKELFARALHLASPRRDAPFIKVNCAAIPETLFESELFGHERGAFTGAQGERAGWFELADKGTIFLDEIGELPLALQTKLLRTLQEGTIVRLGAKREKKVDVRLVAATHRDLEQEASDGRFRRDLFYRLYVIPIRLPSLRERPEDIGLLALHFLSRANQAHQRNVNLSPEALLRLTRHAWPGNIRELANVIERVVLLAETAVVPAQALDRMLQEAPAGREVSPVPPPATPPAQAGPAAPALPVMDPGLGVRDYWRADSHPSQLLTETLARHGGNRSRAAQALGMTARQFSYRLRKMGLDAA
jgi:Nif-specific regulatory protein